MTSSNSATIWFEASNITSIHSASRLPDPIFGIDEFPHANEMRALNGAFGSFNDCSQTFYWKQTVSW